MVDTFLCFILILTSMGWAKGNTDPPTTTGASPPTTTESSPMGEL